MATQVSVVIPARNDAAGLADAVASSLAQTGVEVVEVLICVGPSSDGTDSVAQELSDNHEIVRVVDNPTGGISDALNLGLANAQCEVLVRVDARCLLSRDYAERAVTTMEATGAANVGAVQVPVGHTTTQRAIVLAMCHLLGSGGATYRYRSGDVPRKATSAYLGVFRTSAVRAVGGWDTGFARNEDAELNRRLIEAGHQVWLDPHLRVDYEPRATLRGLARQYFDYGWWRRRMVARHRVVQLRQLAAPAILLGVTVGIVVAATVSIGFLLIPASYLALLMIAAAFTRGPATIGERILIIPALLTMHLCWGAGFLASLIRGPLTIPVYPAPGSD